MHYQKLVNLIKDHKSSHSNESHDYLLDMIKQVKNNPSNYGFFDGEKWIKSLKWDGNKWRGFISHDWKYAMHMQEGACWYSIISKNNELDKEIESEYNYMHSHVMTDGTILGVPDASGSESYEYGIILSCLALGYICFKDKNPSLAEQCYLDMNKMYNIVKNFQPPVKTSNIPLKGILRQNRIDDEYHYILIGFVNAWKVYNDRNEIENSIEIKKRIILWANWFRDNQKNSGKLYNPIQANEKINHALCLSYDVTKDKTYLHSVKKNIDWIIENRMKDNGGIIWKPTNTLDFFECHQLWFLLACKLLLDRNPNLDYSRNMLKAWNFLTDNNWANIDWYVHNKENHNCFFAYRNVNKKGIIQPGSFKGSYEIGAALWSLSINYYTKKK